MRIAVFLEDCNYRNLDEGARRIFLFDVNSEIVTAVGEKSVNFSNINYVVIWLLAKAVKIIYADRLPETARSVVSKAGISLRSLDTMKENPYLKALLIRDAGSE